MTMNKLENTSLNNRKILLIARIIVSIVFLFFSFAIVPKILGQFIESFGDEGLSDGGWEGMVMQLTYFVFLIGFLVSWWKKCIGGILILVSSIIQMAPFLIIDGNLGSLIFGIPLLITALLFMVFCRQT